MGGNHLRLLPYGFPERSSRSDDIRNVLPGSPAGVIQPARLRQRMLRERSPGQAEMGFRNLEVRLFFRRGPDPAKWINRIRRYLHGIMVRVASRPAFFSGHRFLAPISIARNARRLRLDRNQMMTGTRYWLDSTQWRTSPRRHANRPWALGIGWRQRPTCRKKAWAQCD